MRHGGGEMYIGQAVCVFAMAARVSLPWQHTRM